MVPFSPKLIVSVGQQVYAVPHAALLPDTCSEPQSKNTASPSPVFLVWEMDIVLLPGKSLVRLKGDNTRSLPAPYLALPGSL